MPTLDDFEKRYAEEYKYWAKAPDRLRSKLLWFLKAPCPPEECHIHLKYRHLSCLTCPPRRFRQQGERSGFTHYKRVLMILESASGKGFIMPKHYRTHGIIIKTGEDREIPKWKAIPLKILCTLAERIAEW